MAELGVKTANRATRAGQVWSLDFMFDTTEDGRQIKFLNIIDEYTRECLCIKAARSIKHKDVIENIGTLIMLHGNRSSNPSRRVQKEIQ